MQAICPNCGLLPLTLGQRFGATITCTLSGAAIGSKAVRDPYAKLLCLVGGLVLGTMIDRYVERRCPQCGAMLRVAGLFLP